MHYSISQTIHNYAYQAYMIGISLITIMNLIKRLLQLLRRLPNSILFLLINRNLKPPHNPLASQHDR